MRILKNGNFNIKSCTYTLIVRPILEYGPACSHPYRDGQINATDQVQNKTAKFAHHRKDSNRETLAQRRKIARLFTFFKACTRGRAWKDMDHRLQRPCNLSRVDHDSKIRSRKQRANIGKYSSVNRTIQLWDRLPADAVGTLSCKPSNFRKG
jgi:hypothetical protein